MVYFGLFDFYMYVVYVSNDLMTGVRKISQALCEVILHETFDLYLKVKEVRPTVDLRRYINRYKNLLNFVMHQILEVANLKLVYNVMNGCQCTGYPLEIKIYESKVNILFLLRTWQRLY